MIEFQKSVKILIYTLICVLFLSACGKKTQVTIPSNLVEKSNLNSFFLDNEFKLVKFKGRFSSEDEDMIERDVSIQIEKIVELKSGMICRLKIQPIRGVPEERLLLGVFYIQKNKIYKIEPTEENIEIIRKGEKIPTGSNIVCQEEEIKDKLKQEQKGYHQFLLVKEDLREYHSYNNMVETGYFETFIWERNIGLKYYKSGYGAEQGLVELELLNDDD